MWAAIAAVALTLRLVNLWQLSGTPVADLLFGDGRAYDAWARSILAGPWMGREVFYQAPLYPYFLAVVYAVAGPSLLAVRLLQTALGVAACIWLGFAGRRFFSPAVGQLAALGLAIWPSAIFADGVIQKTALDSALICAFLATLAVAIDKTSFRWWMTGGLVLGILALTRENALALVPTTLLVIAAGWHAGPPGARRAPAVAALLLGVTLVLSPVTLRNHSFSGEWHLTTAQFGPNFFIGNHAGATGIYAPLRYGRGDALYERQDATELAEAALGRPLTPGEVSSYWTDRALAFIGEQPVEWAALLARKSALLVNSEEVADTEDQYTHAELSIALAILGPLFNFGFLTPLAAAGVVLAWPRRRTLAPLLLIGGVYGASVVATYVMARYRHPLLPLLLLFAASALIDARRLWRAGARRPLAFAALAATLVAVPANWPLVSIATMRGRSLYNIARSLEDQPGAGDTAIAYYRRAVETDPGYAMAYGNLGAALLRRGDLDEALAHLRRAIELQPSYADHHHNLGTALGAAGDGAAAATAYERALALDPNLADSHVNLGALRQQAGDLDAAAQHYAAAIAIDPRLLAARNNLGIVYALQGDFDRAIDTLRAAADLDPRDRMARENLTLVLARGGRGDEAVAAFGALRHAGTSDIAILCGLADQLVSTGIDPQRLDAPRGCPPAAAR